MRKIALVTGARHRIGAAIASHLVAQGWRVFAHVRREEDAVPDGCERVAADLAEPDCADRIFAAIGDDAAPGLLVNNASLFEEDSLDDPDPSLFGKLMAVNARAPMLLTRAFQRAHAGRGDALIVNILDAKLAAPNPDYASYTLTKGALATLGDMAARALAKDGIRVNAIAPAMMLPSGDKDEDLFERVHDLNPLGRGVDPADLIDALDSFVAQRVVTGQTIWLDAGQRFLALPRDVQHLEDDR